MKFRVIKIEHGRLVVDADSETQDVKLKMDIDSIGVVRWRVVVPNTGQIIAMSHDHLHSLEVEFE